MPHITLRQIPDELYSFVVKIQGEIKNEKKTAQYSLEKTVYKILKEYQVIKEKIKESSAK